jgi:hypothetical protein
VSHPEQVAFVDSIRTRFPDNFEFCEVLEIGSRNVNGTVRSLFDSCRYIGIDCTEGPGVDLVTLAHNFRPPEGTLYDTVISCEAFEHDPFLKKTLAVCVGKYLKKGGLFVATWASPERQEHGTTKSTPEEIYGPDPEYYRGVSAKNFSSIASRWLDPLEVREERGGQDVYAWGIRK